MNSIQMQYKIDTIFTNSGNSKTSDPHRLVFNLADKINLKKSHKLFALSNLSINYTPKNIKKKLFKNNKFKISVSTWNNQCE